MAEKTSLSDHSLKLQILIKEASPMIIDKFRNEFKKLSGAVELVSKATKDFGSIAKLIGTNILVALAGAIVIASKEIIWMDDKVARMGIQFGMSFKQIKEFNAGLYSTSLKAGIVADQLAVVAQNLIESNFKGSTNDLLELSATVYKFSEVTGVSISETADFAGELAKLGINSNLLLKGLGNLRASLQLSTKEFKTVIEVTKLATESLYAYGTATRKISDKEMAAFGKSAGQMAAMLQSIGLSAESTTKIMQGLVDPMEWLNNPLLMTMLGSNFQDTLTAAQGLGNPLENNVELIIKMSDKIKEMQRSTGLGFGFIAKQMGLPAAQLARLANLSEEDKLRMMEQSKTTAELNDIWENMGEAVTHFQRAAQRSFSAFMATMKPVINVLSQTLEIFSFIVDKLAQGTKWISQWGSLGEVITKIIGVAVIAGLVALAGAMWEMSRKTRQAIMGFIELGAGINKVAAGSSQGTLTIEMMAAAIANLGVQASVTSQKMQQLNMATSPILGPRGQPLPASATSKTNPAGSAAMASWSTMFSSKQMPITEELVKNKSKWLGAGQEAGKSFWGSFGKVFGVMMAATTVVGMFQRKRFTVNDVATLLMSIGPFLGPYGLAAAGIGALLAGAGALFGFGDMSIFGSNVGSAIKGKMAVQNASAQTHGSGNRYNIDPIKDKEQYMSMLERERAMIIAYKQEQLLGEIAKNAHDTKVAVKDVDGSIKKGEVRKSNNDFVSSVKETNRNIRRE
jgi:hypothetical protein